MSTRLPHDLSALDELGRLSTFDSALLDRAPDPELQALVTAASTLSGFPIALVSLVARQIQFFRAQVGLPADLAVARATDRCTSFCQFVVASDQCLLIEDATREPGLPKDLVERYGIRAYAGFPLRVMGRTVGAFCIIDAQPRRLEPTVVGQLKALARKASARLEALARQVPTAQVCSGPEQKAHRAWLAVAEAQPLLYLSEQFASGKLSLEEFQRGMGALSGLLGTGASSAF
ncbi:GAF domain-containing protein [Archangium sp.]|jgi:GAF domain-containing protein|uniref:GAF domain-containing protein n=1 Tax=Archangium sp. TaxID=1872627 RepID=UPI002EDB4D63